MRSHPGRPGGRTRVLAALVTGLLTAIGGLVAATSAPASASTVIVGDTIITTDTTWTAENGPYSVTGKVQVAAGATLTIAAGAEVHVAKTLELEGALRAIGTAANPVRFELSAPLFRGIGEYNEPTRTVEIHFADIVGPAAIMGTNSTYISDFVVADSTISYVSEQSYLWYPKRLLFERNVFTGVNTLEVGIDRGATAVFRHNRFREAPVGGYDGYNGESQIVAWAAYGDPVRVEGNVFEASTRPRILEVRIDGQMDARGNYFGSTDTTEVKSWVLDKGDDLNRPGLIEVEPLLATAPVEVPAAVFSTPGAPRFVTAAPGQGAATVGWAAPVSDGGSPITGYAVTASPGGMTANVNGTTTIATVTGLTGGTAYTFTVTAINAIGTGQTSAPSNAVTPTTPPIEPPTPTAPTAPTHVVASPRNASAQVNWVQSDPDGSSISAYTVTASPGGMTTTVPGAYAGATVTGLTNGTAYTFTVRATNGVGVSPPSAPSNAVTPTSPASKPSQVAKPTAAVKTESGAIVVRWNPARANGAPITNYAAYYTTSSGRTPYKLVGGNRLKAVFTGLKPAIYRFRVIAFNRIGVSAPSSAVRVRLRR
jgi:hypothetical protein